MSSFAQQGRVQRSWFSPDIDVLCLGQATQSPAAEIAATTIFLECKKDSWEEFLDPQVTCRFDLGKADHYQNLKVTYVGIRLHIGRGLSAAAVADIFHGEEAVIIELDDKNHYFQEIRRLYAILKSEEDDGCCAGTDALESDSIWATAQGFQCRFKRALPSLQAAIVEGRAQQRSAAGLPVEKDFLDFQRRPNKKLEWVHAAISSANLRPSSKFLLIICLLPTHLSMV